jgi:hypothetical protein
MCKDLGEMDKLGRIDLLKRKLSDLTNFHSMLGSNLVKISSITVLIIILSQQCYTK